MTGAAPQTDAANPEGAPAPDATDRLLENDGPAPAPREPEPAASADAPARDSKVVPHGAMHEERERRKEAEQRAARAEERIARILEASQRPRDPPPQQPQTPQITPRDVNPVEHFDQRAQATEKELSELRNWRQQQEQAAQYQQQRETFKSAYASKAIEFAQEQKDFGEAYQFLLADRSAELQMLGYDSQTSARILEQEELGIAATAMQQNENPAKRLYALAKKRGFRSGSASADKLDTIERGQKAQGLGGASASPPTSGEVTAKQIAQMSNAEFDKWFEKSMVPPSHR